MGNELVVQDAEMLKLLGDMVNKDDSGGSVTGPPTLKINYDAKADYPRGAWVVGQRKSADGKTIEDQGQLAKGLVVLLARNRWSFYDQKNTKRNCNSPFYLRGEQVSGSNYGHTCGKTCPMRADGLDLRCKCQIVLFGKAVTADGKFVDCISYQGGASYMPVQNFIDDLGRAKVKGGFIDIPLFSSLVLLDADEDSNGSTQYFISKLKQGPMFKDRDQVMAFNTARDEVYAYLKRANSALAEASKTSNVATGSAPSPAATAAEPQTQAAAVAAGAQPVEEVVTVEPIVDPAVPDFAKAVTGSEGGAAPWEEATAQVGVTPQAAEAAAASGESAFDLIGAINGLLEGDTAQ